MTFNPRANPTANPTDTRSDLQGPMAPDPDAVGRVAVIGAGTIGASWAALLLSRGMSVAISDPNPAAEVAVRGLIAESWPALERLGLAPGADPEKWSFHTDPRDAARGARFVQVNAPERHDVKRALYAAL